MHIKCCGSSREIEACKVDIDDIEGIVETTGRVSKELYLYNVTVADNLLIEVFAVTHCKILGISSMTLSDTASASLGKCVNNNINTLRLGSNGTVTFNFRLFSACVTDQSKCNKIIYWYDTFADNYRKYFKQFCKQSQTWSVAKDVGYRSVIFRK